MFSSDRRRAGAATRAAAVAGAVALLTGGAGLAAPAAGSWRISRTPVPQLANGSLAAESCTGPAACVAVGSSYGVTGAARTLADTWNGTAWSVQPTPDPAGAHGSILTAVSCVTAASCTAVGSAMNATATAVPLVETWNGTAWTIQAAPVPPGSLGGAHLQGVSCAAASACVAVGYYEDTNFEEYPVAFAESWNGTAWALVPVAGATGSSLYAVSCAAADACVATGASTANSSGTETPLAEAWNGTAWTMQAAARPAGAYSSSLSGVSCTAPDACTAVGGYTQKSSPFARLTLAESWDGTAWTVQPTSNPAADEGFTAVSCTAADACAAVGWQGANTGGPLAEAWNGTAWTTQATARPKGALGSSLGGVGCGAAGACTAVGSASGPSGAPRALALAQAGTTWTITTAPDRVGASGAGLTAVSCAGAGACVAVGSTADALNGATWTPLAVPRPPGAATVSLARVSCVTASACVAVGSSRTGGSGGVQRALAESWDGTAWKVLAAAQPTGAMSSALAGVSCTTASACVAVGSYRDSSGQLLALAEVWNGTGWSIQPAVDPPGQGISLSGVSCWAASACVAVGGYEQVSPYAFVTLAEAWNGQTWSQLPPPGHPGGTLNSVSCATASACVAVGFAGSSPLALAWDGTSWRRQSPPLPANSYEAFLNDVSCPAAGDCAAVGHADLYNSGNSVPVAEAWNGRRWSVQPTPLVTGFQLSGLGGVSCDGAGACTAVGDYGDSLPAYATDAPFAELRG